MPTTTPLSTARCVVLAAYVANLTRLTRQLMMTDRQPHEFENPACRTKSGDPSLWIEETVENKPIAVAICRQCDHLTECAEYAIANEVVGIWGALTTAQRIDLATQAGITRKPILTPIISPKKRDTR